MRRYGLRDDQWDRIMNLLPGRRGTVGVTASDNRLFVEAVLYRYPVVTEWGARAFESVGAAHVDSGPPN